MESEKIAMCARKGWNLEDEKISGFNEQTNSFKAHLIFFGVNLNDGISISLIMIYPRS
jgi:hypothetical protein